MALPEAGAAVRCEVAVVGGGLIGAAAALGVARQGRDVVLVEPLRPAVRRGELGVEVRNVAVSPASRGLLDELVGFADLPGAPYRRMEVWEERGTRAMCFDAAEVGRQELGWIVENSPAVVALWERLESLENVRIAKARLQELTVSASAVTLKLADHPTVTAPLVLAADGAGSPVRQQLGVTLQRYAVEQTALATVVRTERAHQATAYQRFLLDGPLALLPSLDPRQCSVVWSQSPAAAERRRDLAEGAFRGELERALQGRLGRVEAVDTRLTFPLGQQLAASFNPHPRVVLLGDAGRVLHPLAGLGGNLGFEDVGAALAVLASIGAGGDAGADGLWRGFDRARQARSRLLLGLLEGLRRVYGRGDPWSQWLRNLGVGWLDAAPALKSQIMREAMGLGPLAGAPVRAASS